MVTHLYIMQEILLALKITEKAAAEDDSNQMFPSISIANKRCLCDGTSLAAPGSWDVQPGDILESYHEEEAFQVCFFRWSQKDFIQKITQKIVPTDTVYIERSIAESLPINITSSLPRRLNKSIQVLYPESALLWKIHGWGWTLISGIKISLCCPNYLEQEPTRRVNAPIPQT